MFLFGTIQMGADLLVQRRFEPAAMEQGDDARQEHTQRRHE